MIGHLEVDSLRMAQMRLDYTDTWVFFFFLAVDCFLFIYSSIE
jgi:hypothetical protein